LYILVCLVLGIYCMEKRYLVQ